MTVGQANILMSIERAIYRLVGMDGHPHPVLDTPYESVDAAIGAAKQWTSKHCLDRSSIDAIGVEVKTSNGSWRTIHYS
ncbi:MULTISPECIES: hypothetical protein [Prochlorococcus]|uniref:Uncharacterized protein n=1 Tax=Prochlorococcus marinus (strain SARG / CCMP1375 / SS120) TaxID=167539 RepID=Q7VBG2_PROMA|nr:MULTISPECIES: hypothetical protein [Prochlorococcus]AAQ00178.1 Predicted protein [Prochlorococcus marinus subsp. marinus str. CCMP1375]